MDEEDATRKGRKTLDSMPYLQRKNKVRNEPKVFKCPVCLKNLSIVDNQITRICPNVDCDATVLKYCFAYKKRPGDLPDHFLFKKKLRTTER